MPLKTREEIIADYETDNLDLCSMKIEFDQFEECFEFSKDMKDPPEKLHFSMPEGTIYHMTITYRVKKRPIKKMSYHQSVKKHGVNVKSRTVDLGEEVRVNDDNNPIYSITFPPDNVPTGRFIRGTYNAESTFYHHKDKILTCKWGLEVTSKDNKPKTLH